MSNKLCVVWQDSCQAAMLRRHSVMVNLHERTPYYDSPHFTHWTAHRTRARTDTDARRVVKASEPAACRRQGGKFPCSAADRNHTLRMIAPTGRLVGSSTKDVAGKLFPFHVNDDELCSIPDGLTVSPLPWTINLALLFRFNLFGENWKYFPIAKVFAIFVRLKISFGCMVTEKRLLDFQLKFIVNSCNKRINCAFLCLSLFV